MNANAMVSVRPEPHEYAPYYERYISLVADNDILTTLEKQLSETVALLSSRSGADADFRYAPEKWSVKEIVGHLTDSERIFAYRALRISRNDQTPIEGFEQDDYVRFGAFGPRHLSDLVEEFTNVRKTTLSLFRNLEEASWTRRGVASKNEVTVRALAYIIAGHELHHRTILRNKYFSSLAR
jgi:hypothetical protein